LPLPLSTSPPLFPWYLGADIGLLLLETSENAFHEQFAKQIAKFLQIECDLIWFGRKEINLQTKIKNIGCA
jgi:hypothetical protein